MKKILCFLSFSILFVSKINAQINFIATYSSTSTNASPVDFYLTKFSSLGYKYILEDHTAKTIKIYNLNNSLFQSITIPNSAVGTGVYTIFYLSDNLFDLNNDIEYLLSVTSGTPGIPSLYVYKDNGTQMFYKDSVTLIGNSATDVFKNYQNIWYDGTSTKMQIKKCNAQNGKFIIYQAPSHASNAAQQAPQSVAPNTKAITAASLYFTPTPLTIKSN